MTTRNDLLTDKAEIETFLCALGGVSEEIPDKKAIVAITRAIWHILDFLLRRTWGL